MRERERRPKHDKHPNQTHSDSPKTPKMPPILQGANDIVVTDGGKNNDDKHRQHLLVAVRVCRAYSFMGGLCSPTTHPPSPSTSTGGLPPQAAPAPPARPHGPPARLAVHPVPLLHRRRARQAHLHAAQVPLLYVRTPVDSCSPCLSPLLTRPLPSSSPPTRSLLHTGVLPPE